MNTRFVAIIAVLVVAFFGIVTFSKHKNHNSSGGNTAAASTHIEGKNSTSTTLVEYGDYQCPFCGQYYPTIKQVVKDLNAKISFQFRNLPLTSLHPNAFAGARAAEAASLQGKFWQMHDLLYERQTQWTVASNPGTIFGDYAAELNLNVDKFKQDMSSEGVNSTINADLAAFANTGDEQATPTFYLDGKKISPNNDVTSFEKIITDAIANKTKK